MGLLLMFYVVTCLWTSVTMATERPPPVTTMPTTIPVTRMPTTIPVTTMPTRIPGACYFDDGSHYNNGDTIHTDEDWCGGTICQDGDVMYWDHECMFRTPVCYGVQTKVDKQCCPGCIGNITTTPPTTTPRVPPGGCIHNNKVYEDGQTIEEDRYKCYGIVCLRGGIATWDHKCAFRTPPCSGRSTRKDGQCCPACYNDSTTVPTTTTKVPPDGCLYRGKIFQNYDTFSFSQNGCHGSECHYGTIREWNHPCMTTTTLPCNGTLIPEDGRCCPRCIDNIIERCYVNSTFYLPGQVTNTDPCNTCICSKNGTVDCNPITCRDEILDCKVAYQEEGQCCMTCGSSAVEISTVLAFLSFIFQKLQ